MSETKVDMQEKKVPTPRAVAAKAVPKRKPAPKVAQSRAKAPVDRHKTAPQKLKLLITVVNRNKAELYMDLLQSFDINMQLSAVAEGTATSEILHLMGLEESEKRVILSLVRADKAPAALAMLEEKFTTIKNGKGIAMTLPLTGVIGVSIYQFLCNNR